jgi:hypothetical protein
MPGLEYIHFSAACFVVFFISLNIHNIEIKEYIIKTFSFVTSFVQREVC